MSRPNIRDHIVNECGHPERVCYNAKTKTCRYCYLRKHRWVINPELRKKHNKRVARCNKARYHSDKEYRKMHNDNCRKWRKDNPGRQDYITCRCLIKKLGKETVTKILKEVGYEEKG